jgi:membrane protease YdiL (CAAX protease family)
LLFGYFADPHPLNHIGFKKTDHGIFYLLGLLLLIVSFPLVEQLGLWNRMIHFPPSIAKWMREKEDSAAKIIQFMLSKHSVKALLMNIIFIAGLAALGEELFFRGVLQRIFIRMFKNPWAGIIITAFLFSAIHMQFYGFLPRLLLGVFLGLIYWYSGSLWPAIFAHFIYDASLITLAYFHPEMIKEESTGVLSNYQLIIPALISLILTLAIVRLMKKKSAVTYEKVYADDDKRPDPFEFE